MNNPPSPYSSEDEEIDDFHVKIQISGAKPTSTQTHHGGSYGDGFPKRFSTSRAKPTSIESRGGSYGDGFPKSKQASTSRVKPKHPIPNPREKSTSSQKSKNMNSDQDWDAVEDAFNRAQLESFYRDEESIPAPRAKSIASGKSVSSRPSSTKEAQKDNTSQGLQLQSASRNFMYLGSTNQTKDDLWMALLDHRYHSIGLVGEKGSGKTALVKSEIPKYREVFRPVVFITVSEKPDIANLQNQIAYQLNLDFQGVTSQYRRASVIESKLLKNTSKVLVIFDDVSTNFDPQDIGVPSPSSHCKTLLITHDKKYCNMMRCMFPLRPLSDDDAWKLLQQFSGIDREYSPPDLFDVAHEVALRCKGLPRVIEDVVSALNNRNTEHWKETLDCLKHSIARHQVFISFRGRDTRDDFTASLFDALVQGGFKVFKDDEQLRSGDQVSEALIKAIEQSRCSIVVLSENYAESSWCLDELVKILKCREEMKQLVLPIFYKVDPAYVRYQKGSFGEAMTKNKGRFQNDKIQEWTSALFQVAGLSGRDYKIGSQIVFIKEIVQYIRDNKYRLHIV